VVQPGIEAAGEDEEAIVHPELGAQQRRRAVAAFGRSAAETRARREGDDPDVLSPDVEEAASGLPDGPRPDHHCRRLPQELSPEPVPEPGGERSLEGARHLPRSQVEQRRDDGQARGDRERAATDDVVHGAGGARAVGSPGDPQ
jgi:hypothetical protein